MGGDVDDSLHDVIRFDAQRHPPAGSPPINPLEELHYALETMQTHFFELWLGTWPNSIDWTGAVLGTYVDAALYTLTNSLEYILPTLEGAELPVEGQRVENEINKYFSQVISYYFGENDFAIRTQAHDDMLWVVLGWLQSVRFIDLHTAKHYPASRRGASGEWYGVQFMSAFAHRAHVFYDLAAKGWDTKLCGGGMTWNPHLRPYKNAITNELFISASIEMYLYFPGDRNPSPFVAGSDAGSSADAGAAGIPVAKPHDPKYLRAAIDGYAWLKDSNMTNERGLYVDGFHIHGWSHNGSIGTGKCDERNEMVYTYNQGVLLSGLRGLWESTDDRSYLEDGHTLVRNVINATGWKPKPDSSGSAGSNNGTGRWAGLGRGGILEEMCDAAGTCTQNGQTFKGIFFHHLTLFCAPLPRRPLVPGRTYAATPVEASLHAQSCKEYAPWVAFNARAAMKTRNERGEFGMWWGWPAGKGHLDGDRRGFEAPPLPDGAVDYRNNASALLDWKWSGFRHGRVPSTPEWRRRTWAASSQAHAEAESGNRDANDRGRGRTVETQGGGVSVLRAMWELVKMYGGEK
ncbi:hypothetical protein BDY21DRAFT_284415 [Lineolata rhizophorae]|uniref:Six-hairpin glycosidase-like protein n=1 Tax=Lineolata rhizophorae TaxID=578093 RepID=A0A6A6P300_9PEZI|nr:hypothetical protein BDY21DRAFT_284415 [Lineolata rhizophorae]